MSCSYFSYPPSWRSALRMHAIYAEQADDVTIFRMAHAHNYVLKIWLCPSPKLMVDLYAREEEALN